MSIRLKLVLPCVGVLLVASLAGCATPKSAASEGTGPAVDIPTVNGQIRPDLIGTLAIPITGAWTSEGDLRADQFTCAPEKPGGCEYYSTIFLDFTGTFTGRMTDIFHFHWAGSGSTVDAQALRLVTGSFAGCGSGTMSMRIDGPASIDPNPDKPGSVHMKEPLMSMVPGSTSTGLAAVVDAQVTLEFNLTGDSIHDGTINGAIWCRMAAVPDTSPSHEGAVPIEVNAKFTTDGILLPHSVACNPPTSPQECELYETQYVDYTGTMNGTLTDPAHAHSNGDGTLEADVLRPFTGSIAGCGSGTLVLHLKGTTGKLEPNLSAPGTLHLVEPKMTLFPGSTTAGFAGVVDANLTNDFIITGPASGYGTISGTIWCKTAAVNETPADAAAARIIPVATKFETDGYAVLSSIACAPTNPGGCEFSGTEMWWVVTGTFNGTVFDRFHAHGQPDGTFTGPAERTFTGSIAGCGSGTLTLTGTLVVNFGEPDTTYPGYVTTHEILSLVPGSGTAGFADLVDAQITADYAVSGTGNGSTKGATMAGTVTCR